MKITRKNLIFGSVIGLPLLVSISLLGYMGLVNGFTSPKFGPTQSYISKSTNLPERCREVINGGMNRDYQYLFCRNSEGDYSMFQRGYNSDGGWHEIVYRR